ncbi:MAG: hypothetical protein J7K00_04150 [Candidatus Diapherotrites archaeon]|nr:hypothetical protein [Candidatus Diapherotrites archaeon]
MLLSDVLTGSKCLIGNVFLAECKEQPLWVKRKNPYEKYIVRLKKSAGCEVNYPTLTDGA